MRRDAEIYLKKWRDHPLRKPLVLRGARQVGKSWLARRLGEEFEHFVEINFERDQNAKKLFEGDINIQKIVEQIGLYKHTKMIPGKTLLFLDEIQECEQALKSLRYFKEDFPELHVISAGSLLDFAIEKVGLPVGRLQFLFIYPLSFGEYLSVLGCDDLRAYLSLSKPHEVLHEKLLEHVKYYFWLGGMPAVVKAWRDHKNSQYCLEVQDEIITTYREDFEKYTTRRNIEYVEKVFNSIPSLLGEKFKYVNVDPDVRAKALKDALSLLKKAGVAHLSYHSSGQGHPLGATKDEDKFKVFFFDIGLAQRLLKLDLAEWLISPLEVRHMGAITEQFVAQEYTALSPNHTACELYYWQREKAGSSAEVDFLFQKDGQIIPVEVKAGTTGSLKSLHLFLSSHKNSTFGIKISESPFREDPDLVSLPFYLLEPYMKSP